MWCAIQRLNKSWIFWKVQWLLLLKGLGKSYIPSMRFVSQLYMWCVRRKGFANQIQSKRICYNCFVLWWLSRWKMLLVCAWHAWSMILCCCEYCVSEWCRQFSWWKALGFHAVKLEWIYHVDLRNLPCVWILYKLTFDATNQCPTRIIIRYIST